VDFLPFVIAGLVTGAIYGLSGVGLVLTYKTSGIFNFAQGSLATISAFAFYTMSVQHSVPWPVAGVIAVFVVGPLLGLAMERLARVLAGSSFTIQVAGMVGILLMVEAAVQLIYGTSTTRVVPQYLPAGGVRIGGTFVSYADIVIFGVAVLLTAGLHVYLKRARAGLAMRAVVDDPALLDLAATSPVRIRRRAWIIGSTLAALSGVLLAPLLPEIDATTLTLLIISAFGAAAIGGFTALPGTFAGGLVIGVAEAVAGKYFTSAGSWAGFANAVPFIALFVVLLVSPRRRGGRQVKVSSHRSSSPPAPLLAQLAGGLLVLAFLAAVPLFAGIYLIGWMTFLSNVILFLSLGLLVRSSGQVSLCQVGFAAIGVAAFSHLTALHIPWLVALALCGLVVVPVGALLAIPAIRLNGLYLALATLGFGLVLNDLFYGQPYMFGDVTASVTVPRPSLGWLDLQSDSGFYYLMLVLTALTCLLVIGLSRGRLGRLLGGLASSPVGLSSSGASINVTRVLVFCIAAFLAAIAGALGGAAVGVVSAGSYTPLISVTYFAVVIITVGREPWYAVLAAAGYTLLPLKWTGEAVTDWLTFAFGAFAVLYALGAGRMGMPSQVHDALARLPWGRPNERPTAGAPPATGAGAADSQGAAPDQERSSGTRVGQGLRAENIVVRFGGLVAVRDVSLEAPAGTITGLIGPNGAGKSTTLNACSGLVGSASGRVHFDTRTIDRLGPAARARLGIGRTFQQIQLCDELSVRANVALGVEAGFAGVNPLSHMLPSRGDRHRIDGAAAEAMRLCGIEDIADQTAKTLSTGQRRLVELARCLAGSYQVLLLDEPSSGLDRAETERFGQLLQHVVGTRGVGILLIEHDMSLVTSICDYVYVLDFGEPIFAGTPSQVLASPVVQQAYLGIAGDSEDPALGRAG
jgi:ABC-type branched-subunit amino acid transport system ATPase component/branched-subunit amino acid ABC-type transport system permease component